MKAMQFMQGFAPQYQSGQTRIGKTYGMPIDPIGLGMGAAFGAYRGLRQEPTAASGQNDPAFQQQFSDFMKQFGGQGQTGQTTPSGGSPYGGGYA